LKALSLPVLASIYFFGLRSLFILILVNIIAFLTEYIFNRFYNKPVSSSVFVTGVLFTLTLPPTLPYWMAAVGIIFGVLFGKMVFGGFGKNIFNPALVGRVFLYINFGNFMTGSKIWAKPFTNMLGGFVAYLPDTITAATPLADKNTNSYLELFVGNHAGAIGATSILLILLGGIYIVYKKIADYRIVFSLFVAVAITQTILVILKVVNFNPLYSFLSGGLFFGAFFMATDPITASSTKTGKWIYGAFIGLLTVLIRVFSSWPEGIMFAILLANMFAPIMDYYIKRQKREA
jgi:Na+-transporting NADH:ubiquinone oxidoreductase subunit B